MTRLSPDASSHDQAIPTHAAAHPGPDTLGLLAVLRTNGDLAGADASDRAHLDACAACRLAVDAHAERLDLDRQALAALVDEPSTDAALAAQRRSILDRLAVRRDGGRVLDFPARAVRPIRRDRPGARWLAAAAAAGLFVGMLAGPRLQPMLGSPLFSLSHSGASRLATRPPSWAADSTGEGAFPHAHDELFLSELETAVNNRGAIPLRALDDLTPEPVVASVRTSR